MLASRVCAAGMVPGVLRYVVNYMLHTNTYLQTSIITCLNTNTIYVFVVKHVIMHVCMCGLYLCLCVCVSLYCQYVSHVLASCVCMSLYCQYVSYVLASRAHTRTLVFILLYMCVIQAPFHRPHPLVLYACPVLILLGVSSCYCVSYSYPFISLST